jgi:hypothetical protein
VLSKPYAQALKSAFLQARLHRFEDLLTVLLFFSDGAIIFLTKAQPDEQTGLA